MMPDSEESSYSSARSLASSSGPRRKLRSARAKALVSEAILKPGIGGYQGLQSHAREYRACERKATQCPRSCSPTCYRSLSPSCLASSGKKVLLCRT